MLKPLSDQFADFAGKFYDRGTAWAGKLSGIFKLARLATWLRQRLSKEPARLGVELLVALSLAITFYFLVRPACLPYRDGNQINAQTFSYLWKDAPPVSKALVQLNWRKRLAGPILTGWLVDRAFKSPNFAMDAYQNIFGFYHATWLLFLFLLLIRYRQDALVIMLGVFGGLMYNLTDPSQPALYYPWDMPTMFFFTLACLLYDRRRMGWLMAAIWLGGLFKETTLCCALLILLGEHWPLKQRIIGFMATVLATFATNKLLMLAYGVSAPLLAMNDAPHLADIFRNTRLFDNVELLFSLDLRHVLFANAGSLLIIMLIPWRNRRDLVFKTMILAVLVGQFFCGIVNEFRIWYELLPLGWMIIADRLLARDPTTAAIPPRDNRADRVWKGSYWLTISGFLALALGALVIAKLNAPTLEDKDGANRLAVEKLITLASRGNLAAQYKLGQAYEKGLGVPQDPIEAVKWYRLAAKQGDADAQNSLGLLLIAEQRDYPGAAQWFALAAKQGNADAEYNLGSIYYQGLGVNYEFAAHWFQQAAQQGHPRAQRDLGLLYMRGLGVKTDCQEAYKWLKLARLQDDAEAENELKACAAAMSADQIAAAEKAAREFRPPRPSPAAPGARGD